MANKKAGFITGANAKIKIAGKVIAFATNVGYDINVQTIPIEGIGRYEPWSNEPVSYSCSGSMSVIRYTKRAKESGVPKVDQTGNTIDQIPISDTSKASFHFDPSQ